MTKRTGAGDHRPERSEGWQALGVGPQRNRS